jgi:hypothetical protein
MSRISRYQESVCKFIKSRSAYCDIIKNNDIETIINLNDHSVAIMLLTIMNGQYKKKKMKSYHGYYIASGIDLMMTTVMIRDNINYYKNKFGKTVVKNFINQSTIHIYNSYLKNTHIITEIIDDIVKQEKLQKKIQKYLLNKLLDITQYDDVTIDGKVHRTDIIKYNFTEKDIIEKKYKNLNLANETDLMKYVERTYGTVCQCSFVLGWLFGDGDEKTIQYLEKMGNHFGYLIKLSLDFEYLEQNIVYSKNISTNCIVNLGIQKCFELFDDNKTKLIEGLMYLGIYNITIKEVMDNIEKNFDKYLENTDLELQSKYTSFS